MIDENTATEPSRVTVSFSPSEETVAEAVDADSYRAYLRRAHAGEVTPGDEWEELVNSGCGTTRDVTFRIESTTEDGVIDERTEFKFVPRTEK